MARLLIKTAGLENQVIHLKLGLNRIGRSPDNDFQIAHPTVSSTHCEILLKDGAVVVRDLDSTNGTFVNDERVGRAFLSAGQTVRLGDVELFVETTDVTVAIPIFSNTEIPVPPVVTTEGAMICPRHPGEHVTHRCTHCKEVMCEACVHKLWRKGSSKVLLLCPICSSPIELIGAPPQKKKKSLLGRLGETVKMKFTRAIRLHN
jgi:pSer/pThr/pTyr-binding forkhead associated (FHA) protein